MAIITISRNSFSRGKEIAEAVARKLGYTCISREILLEASEHFNIPQIILYRAIHDAPSILDRFSFGKERFIAFFRSALLDNLRHDNVVYHGLAGHFFVREISHALKVRIIVDIHERAKLEMLKEKLSLDEAIESLRRDDEQRRKWSKHLYGIDTSDPTLYDLVLNVKKITTDEAAEIISCAAKGDSFVTSVESQQKLDDLTLAAKVTAALVDVNPHAYVKADRGRVWVSVKAHVQEHEMVKRLEVVARKVRGVKDVTIELQPITLYSH